MEEQREAWRGRLVVDGSARLTFSGRRRQCATCFQAKGAVDERVGWRELNREWSGDGIARGPQASRNQSALGMKMAR